MIFLCVDAQLSGCHLGKALEQRARKAPYGRTATIPAPTVAAVNAEVPIEGWQLLVDSFFQFSELATL